MENESEKHEDQPLFPLKKCIYMPPLKSMIAELLEKQARMNRANSEADEKRYDQESIYYDLEQHARDRLVLSPTTSETPLKNNVDQLSEIVQTTENSPTTMPNLNITEDFQQEPHDRKSNLYSLTDADPVLSYCSTPECSDSSSVELPTNHSNDSAKSHDALNIFAWNRKMRNRAQKLSISETVESEYCLSSNYRRPY